MKSKAPFHSKWKQSQLGAIWNSNSSIRQPRHSDFNYLRTSCADNLAERLEDITKPLETCADVGSHAGEFGAALERAERTDLIKQLDQFVLHPNQLDSCPSSFKGLEKCSKSVLEDWTKICPNGPLKPESYDLIVSNLSLHWVNDIGDSIKQIRAALKPDGVFMASMFGGDTLHELRASMAIAEQEREGGISPHISPMLPIADACGLLSGAGLRFVTVDTAKIEVEYENAFSLMRNLWWMGESNACSNRRLAVSKDTMLASAAIYQHLFGVEDTSGKLRKIRAPATFEIIFMIGWAPSEDQSVPLKPGEGKVSLTKLGKGGSI